MGKRAKAVQRDPKRAIGYIRVSKDTDCQELGAEAQRQAVEQWAAKEGVEVVAWHVEEVSGAKSLDKRPVLLQAIADCLVHNAAWLAVHRLDRFSRDPLSAALAGQELFRQGASLSVAEGGGGGDDPTSELVRGILLSVAKFERALIRARIKAALAVKRQRGELTGQAPFGWRRGDDGKTLEPCPAEQAVISRVRELRASGLSERGIVTALQADFVVGRTGKPLAAPQVHRLLTRSAAAKRVSVAA